MTEPCGACGNPIPPGLVACPNCGTAVTGNIPTITSGGFPPASPGLGQFANTHLGGFDSAEPTVVRRSPSIPSGGGAPPSGYPPASPVPPFFRASAPAPGKPSRHGLAIGLGIGLAVVVIALAATVIILVNHNKSNQTTAASTGHETDTSLQMAKETTDLSSGARGVETPTVTDAPTTTASSGPGVSILTPGVSDSHGSVDVIQQVATALANGDWPAARALRPDLSNDDATLESGYGGLEQSTVIATSVSGDGTEVHGAYVAWETTASGDQTSIYCTDWTVDPDLGEVTNETSKGLNNSQARWSRWVAPSDAVSDIEALCG